MARGNQYWRFRGDVKRQCPICEKGTGQMKNGAICSYCEGTGRGAFAYEWDLILPAAAEIVESYKEEDRDTATVTLRQLFYRLVSAEMLPNTQQAYGSLSSWTAKARREGWFPRLMDRGRDIDRPHLWSDAADAARWLLKRYMEDRSATQPYLLYVVVEKNALRGQLFQWFAPMGLPVIALGGYPSQTLADEVYDDIVKNRDLKDVKGKAVLRGGEYVRRQAICIYAGDFDADGQDIARDFEQRVGIFDEVVKIALTPAQIEEFELPPQPGKWSSARAKGFADKYRDLFESVYGYDLVQIELDALPPEELRRIYQEAIDEYFDYDAHKEVIAHEKQERAKVEELTEDDNEEDEG